MKRLATLLLLLTALQAGAQADTIDTRRGGLLTKYLKAGKASYVVYFTDSASGRRISSADIWDRGIELHDSLGRQWYRFSWQVWRRDSLAADVVSTGAVARMQPLAHEAEYKGRGHFGYVFDNGVVTVPPRWQRTAKDSTMNVRVDPPGFAFPMDLELFPLLPFKKVGQEFQMAFYEPGSPKSDYYKLTVTGREDLALPGGARVNCWLLRIDYGRGTSATFWIADKERVVLKMQEAFRGRYRYKVRLY
ncbi:hypothetical protein EPD60_10705 [Flaviaesturariibacter flavus]|uniref:DUF3108 domain-containing protein n=1 Tax=Flaviaesturariibacter flavus TaxID=2502780 RepID=A0A4V2NVR1_9BACT|nr:hypothetical protein [Flaviaesturariibacter flavus]TCJ14452.1 hypothetical protein EPD60_10705 [Flaviaesturariibacter flavus]